MIFSAKQKGLRKFNNTSNWINEARKHPKTELGLAKKYMPRKYFIRLETITIPCNDNAKPKTEKLKHDHSLLCFWCSNRKEQSDESTKWKKSKNSIKQEMIKLTFFCFTAARAWYFPLSSLPALFNANLSSLAFSVHEPIEHKTNKPSGSKYNFHR